MAGSVDLMSTPPSRPVAGRRSPSRWARDNLFSTRWNSLLTLLLVPLLALAVYRAGRFVLVDGQWEIIEVNLRLLLVWRFPTDEMWRLWAAMFLMAGLFALAAGVAGAARAAAVAAGTEQSTARPGMVRRIWPMIVLVAVLLSLSGSVTALILVTAGAVVVAALRRVGARLPGRFRSWALAAALAAPVASFVLLTGFEIGRAHV